MIFLFLQKFVIIQLFIYQLFAQQNELSTEEFLATYFNYWDPRGIQNLTYLCGLDLEILSGFYNPKNPLDYSTITSKFLDASAKISPGFWAGGLTFWGSPLQCSYIQIGKREESELIYGQYNRIFLNSKIFGLRSSSECFPDEKSNVRWDLCLPDSCEETDSLKIFQQILDKSNWNPTDYNKSIDPSPICYSTNLHTNDREIDTRYWISIVILMLPIIIGISSSIVKYALSSNRDLSYARLWQLLFCFSITSNINSITSLGSTKKRGQIKILDFIRTISISWVILGHCCIYIRMIAHNIEDVRRTKQSILMEIVYNGYFAVDNFFFISGLLIAYIFLKQIDKTPKLIRSPRFWVLFYFHRIIRIMPAYFMVLIFKTYVFPVIVNGSLQNMGLENSEDICKQAWWTNLLFINNIFGSNSQCIIPAWYLATDFQIYALTPPFLILLAFRPIFGLILIVFGILLSTSAHFYTVFANFYPPTAFIDVDEVPPDALKLDLYNRNVYYAAWIRCQVYLIGMLVGCLLKKKPILRFNQFLVFPLYLLSMGLMLTSLSSLHPWRNGKHLSRIERALYSSLSRIGWTFGLAFILLASQYGYSGPLERLYSLKIWTPFAKLSYCVYLLHSIVAQFLLSQIQGPVMFNGIGNLLFTFFIPTLVLSNILSLLWSSIYELSVVNLERLFLYKPQPIVPSNNSSYNTLVTTEEIIRL